MILLNDDDTTVDTDNGEDPSSDVMHIDASNEAMGIYRNPEPDENNVDELGLGEETDKQLKRELDH